MAYPFPLPVSGRSSADPLQRGLVPARSAERHGAVQAFEFAWRQASSVTRFLRTLGDYCINELKRHARRSTLLEERNFTYEFDARNNKAALVNRRPRPSESERYPVYWSVQTYAVIARLRKPVGDGSVLGETIPEFEVLLRAKLLRWVVRDYEIVAHRAISR